jgi:hypothetical protein
MPGKSPVLATSYQGSVRVQVVPATAAAMPRTPTADRNRLALVVKAEPKVQWYYLQHLNLSGARDENNQRLEGIQVVKDQRSSDVLSSDLGASVYTGDTDSVPSNMPVVLQLGTRPVKFLKELHGNLEALVQSPRRAFWTIDKILEARGKTAQDEDGGSVKVLEVNRQEDGTVSLALQITGVGTMSRSAIRRGGGRRGRVNYSITNGSGVVGQLTLVDDKDNPYRQTRTVVRRMSVNGEAIVQEVEATFQIGPNAQASRLMLTGTKPTFIQVPFTVNDVKVP